MTGLPPIDLHALFAPRSVAVVGASPRSDIAQTVRDNLLTMGSATTCYFVNPKYDEAWGSPCYPDLASLPEVPDSVLVALNPLRAASVTEEAARAGARSVLIPGGGVVEGGEAAAQMQRDVRDIALRHGLAVLGPNCMGMIDRTSNSAVYIGDINPWAPRGRVAGIAQSGSVTDAFIHFGTRIGFSRIIGAGSEAVLDVCDYVAYCLDDPETDAIMLFVEGFKRPERFLALADRALELGKPILALKVGRSRQAQAAAVAHSGSLAGETRATDAALAAAGVVRCDDLDALFEAAELHAGCRRMGRGVGRGRMGIVTVSTGEASLIADIAQRVGADLPPVPAAARSAILRDLPTLGYVGNPIDPWGATDEHVAYPAVLEAFAASGGYDVLAIVHDFPYRSLPSEVAVAEGVAEALVAATADRPGVLPIYLSLTSGEPTPEILAILERAGGVPCLRGTTEALAAIAGRTRWEAQHAERLDAGPRRATWPALAADRTPLGHDGSFVAPGSESLSIQSRTLPERESLALLAAAGLAVVRSTAAVDADEAVAAAGALGYPVVLKLDGTALAHKTELGGVRLGLAGPEEVRVAALELLAIGHAQPVGLRGLLVAPQLEAGVELIVGLRRDAQFGPLVLVGIGGVLAEALDDVAIELAPLSAASAAAMLDRLRGAAILAGPRGRPPVDRAAIVELVVALGELGWQRPDLLEVDLNPVIAGDRAAIAVDALVVLEIA
ncbi:MAG TPA: acetate--CoA ligase family protein [Candidatus Limnocylindrales bacterium]